jgi:tetratricopeptide (TPR) repeat protein
MAIRILRTTLLLALGCGTVLPGQLLAQGEGPGTVGTLAGPGRPDGTVQPIDLDVYIEGPNGAPFEGASMVTITRLNGQFYSQATAKAGYLKLSGVPQTEYNVQVVAPGFAEVTKHIDAHVPGTTLVKVTLQLQSAAEGEEAIPVTELATLSPKAQQEIGKAFEELGSKLTLTAEGAARVQNHLEAAYRLAPTNAEVQYLYGVYWLQMYKRTQAKSAWTKAIELSPKHYRAMISLSQALLDEGKADEALGYLERAIQVEPSSWRAYALSADAYFRKGNTDEAVKAAESALELGHGQAAIVQRYLAAVLAKRGEKDKAVSVLQAYVRDHRADAAAKKQLEKLQSPALQGAKSTADATSEELMQPGTMEVATTLPLPADWLPEDTDKRVPAVEPGAACALDDVVKRAGQRIQEFIVNVDRFVATESWNHETINKWGLESASEKRRYDHLVSIKELKPGLFDVQEYRKAGGPSSDFPDGVESKGLPALVLIFHPNIVGNFDLSCEGLARKNGVPAWQVHFRQRADRPNNLRAYKVGINGSSYPVSVKGRAWIAADSYQIVSLETDLVSPIPEIRLAAEHTFIEYGPVSFRERKVDMWLPQSAEVYCDWRGRRFHRRHSFSKYLLFSVDDKQTISAPKAAAEIPPKSSEPVSPNP